METNDTQYESFLNEVDPVYRDFVNHINDYFLRNGCKTKIELAKNGYVVSYLNIKSKKVIANFVFRKKGLIIRIYGDNYNKYSDFISELPQGMIESIDKSPACKRLIDPTKCNSRCPMGYDFTIKDARFIKCRYNCFMFEVNDENIPFITTFVENEVKERAAV